MKFGEDHIILLHRKKHFLRSRRKIKESLAYILWIERKRRQNGLVASGRDLWNMRGEVSMESNDCVRVASW